MPNPRVLASIGLASAAAAIAVSGPEPALERPVVYAISIARDTIWFCADVGPRDDAATFAFARSTRAWARVPRGSCTGDRRIAADDDTTVLGGRMLASIATAEPPREGQPQRRFLRIDDSASGKRIDLRPTLAPARVARLLEGGDGGDVGPDTIAVGIGAAVVNDTIAFIGLAGGFAEGMGDLGGLYRIDRRTGAWEFFTDSTLAGHTVTALVLDREWLWAGTENPAEYGPFGDAGLLRLDTRTGAWTAFADSVSPLPGALVHALAADSRALAVATDRGLAVVELGRGAPPGGDEAIARWNARWFVPEFIGDSLVFALGDRSRSLPSFADEAPFLFLQRYALPGRERPMHDALKGIDTDSMLKAALDPPEQGGRALADTARLPLFISMFGGQAEAQAFAASAVAAIGARAPDTAKAVLRRAFAALDAAGVDSSAAHSGATSSTRVALGIALTRVGDSSGVEWARNALEQLVRGTTPGDSSRRVVISSAARILAAARDRVGLTLLISATPVAPEGTRYALIESFAAYDTPMAWGAVISFTRAGRFDRQQVVGKLGPGALVDPVVGERVRDVLRASMESPHEGSRLAAIQAVERLRLIEFAPALVGQLPDTTRRYAADAAVVALVSLTGRSDAPPRREGVDAATVEWWRKWLSETLPRLVAVPAEQGQRALADWSRRRFSR